MPLVWQRHPRYAILVFFALFVTFLLLNPYQKSDPSLHDTSTFQKDLPNRLHQAERIYRDVLNRRKGLVQRFGPSPQDISV